MVRQRTGTGNQCVCVLLQSVGGDKIEGTDFVATEGERQKIVTLE
jgi:hypothetical protein